MRSTRLVSNLWLAMSSTTRTTKTLSACLTAATANSRCIPASAVALGATRSNSDYAHSDGMVGNSSENIQNDDDVATSNDSNDDVIRELSRYHPIVIEGMGYYDPRDPSVVAKNICETLKTHFSSSSHLNDSNNKNQKPYLVVVQGDPLSERGISAITPLVAKSLGLERGLVCLDPRIDPTHAQNADRENVVLEIKYSQMASVLLSPSDTDNNNNANANSENNKSILQTMEESIDALISQKNLERQTIGKPPMKDYFKQYALLQEVTKASLRKICGDQLTIVHTSAEINPFSVTSFYRVGLDLGLYHEATDMVTYRNHYQHHREEVLDFDAIDKR